MFLFLEILIPVILLRSNTSRPGEGTPQRLPPALPSHSIHVNALFFKVFPHLIQGINNDCHAVLQESLCFFQILCYRLVKKLSWSFKKVFRQISL